MARSDIIDIAGLKDRLAGTALPADPTDVVMPAGSELWPATMREQLAASLKPAGVLVPLMEKPSGDLNVLLTQRSAELKLHAGQISFPGGRMEGHDPDIAATALRETHEEVGIAREHVSVIGYLDPMPTVTGYAVTATIGVVRSGTTVEVDHNEVEYAFEVPLSFLVEPGNAQLVERELYGRSLRMVEYHYDGQRIWGATAMLIQQFVKIII